MTNGMFELLPFTGVNTYYKNYTCSYDPSGQCGTPRDARAFPDGFRMLAGDTDRRTLKTSDQWQQAILIEGPNGEQYGMPSALSDRLQADVRFPSCWDGVNFDSPNHQDHVAYPDPALDGDTERGMCPESYPVALISLGSEFGFELQGVTDPTSLVFSNGDTTGYGFHADFIQGWTNSTALQDSFANCFDNDNCSWRLFDSPTGEDPNPSIQPPEVAPIYEVEIGLNGPLSALPGDNPIYNKSSSSASASSSTKAPAISTSSSSSAPPVNAIITTSSTSSTHSTTATISTPASSVSASISASRQSPIYITVMSTETVTTASIVSTCHRGR